MPYRIRKSLENPRTNYSAKGGLFTFDEFYERVGDTPKADLLDGKIVRESPIIPRHALEVTWLKVIIHAFIEKFDLGIVLGATVTVRLGVYNSPEPDIFFISKERLSIINDEYVDGPPDLCIEVISGSSRKHDRGRKFVLYAEHGVKEYWIVDPIRTSVDWFENQGGQFVSIPPDVQGRLHSKVLAGFWLKPEWLAANQLPPVFEVLEEILGHEQRAV